MVGVGSWDRAVVETSCFPVVSGMIQLGLLCPGGTGWPWELLPHWLWGPWLPHQLLLGRMLEPAPLLLCPLICSTADAEPRGCTSLVRYGLSLLCSALEAAWLLWPSVLGCGHHQSSLCCCPHVATSCSQSLSSLLLQCQGKDSMFLLLLQIMKLRFKSFFFSNRILVSDQVEKS